MTASRAGTLLKGLGALVALIVAVVGVPILLQAVAGSPIPSALPTLDAAWSSLTSRDDGTLLLSLLKYAAWAGWALFVLGVVTDVATRLRGLPAPKLGPQQQLATQLVGAVLALAVSVPTALPAKASSVHPATSASQPVATTSDERGRPRAAGQTLTGDTTDQQSFEEYRVRRDDCLWDIAWNELGEPERWPEIFEASRSISQPDGRRLTDPDLIVTGWVLHIPAPGSLDDKSSASDEWPLGGTQSDAAPDQDAVVTPFARELARTPPQQRSQLELPGPNAATPLVTPLTPSEDDQFEQPSAMEAHWRVALRGHRRSGDSQSHWRSHLPGAT